MMPRILYCQYTNPAAYPPLEHSARILARRGWAVRILGTGAFGADRLRFRPHPGITVDRLPYCPGGWSQKLHYLRYAAWVGRAVASWRPHWLYVSDPLACPIAVALRAASRARVVYHEHDSPPPLPAGSARGFTRVVVRARRRLARRAVACVLPNEARAARFRAETGTRADVVTVWNCAALDEVVPDPRAPAEGALWLLYHGSLTPARLPLTVIDALALTPPAVHLRVIGYETVGHRGYLEAIRARAAARGVGGRVQIVGAVADRAELLAWCRRSDVGLALMPRATVDPNEQAMVGASNKPFDYLASGLALVVSDVADWRLFVELGLARPCLPDDPASVATAVTWYLEHPDAMRSMGERGRQRILAEWNYERAFVPVLRRLLSDAAAPEAPAPAVGLTRVGR